MEIRELDPASEADQQQARDLSIEAFGEWPAGSTPPPLPSESQSGRRTWGAFDGDRLVAKVEWHEYESWFGGRRVPTAGIAGVTVAAEHRGAGLLRPLFEEVWTHARASGAVVSTLYPTANGIYRSLGYEVISSQDVVALPSAELARISRPVGVTTRRATVDDLAAVRAVYDRWAAAQSGPLTRTGPLFAAADAEVLDAFTAISLAVDDDGDVVGYLSWRRGTGYDRAATLRVSDLLATSAEAYRALWHLAGTFASVVGTVRVRTSGHDPARLVLPTSTWDVVERHPYALAVLDDAAAFGALDVELPGDLDLTPQGKALLFAGAQNCANLRLLGHLRGPDHHDAALDVALCGRPLHVRDYF